MATAAPTALQNVGILANFASGSTAWDVAMEKNFRMVDALIQPRVLDKDLATPPASPASGDTYIVAASPTDLWVGNANKIARYSGSAWEFFTAKSGWEVYVVDESLTYRYSGSAWVNAASIYVTHYSYSATYAASAKLMQPQVITRPTVFPAGFAGSQAKCEVAATDTHYQLIQKNGSTVGYIHFPPGVTTGSMIAALGAATIPFAVGDILKVVAPAEADATLAGISISLLGTM